MALASTSTSGGGSRSWYSPFMPFTGARWDQENGPRRLIERSLDIGSSENDQKRVEDDESEVRNFIDGMALSIREAMASNVSELEKARLLRDTYRGCMILWGQGKFESSLDFVVMMVDLLIKIPLEHKTVDDIKNADMLMQSAATLVDSPNHGYQTGKNLEEVLYLQQKVLWHLSATEIWTDMDRAKRLARLQYRMHDVMAERLGESVEYLELKESDMTAEILTKRTKHSGPNQSDNGILMFAQSIVYINPNKSIVDLSDFQEKFAHEDRAEDNPAYECAYHRMMRDGRYKRAYDLALQIRHKIKPHERTSNLGAQYILLESSEVLLLKAALMLGNKADIIHHTAKMKQFSVKVGEDDKRYYKPCKDHAIVIGAGLLVAPSKKQDIIDGLGFLEQSINFRTGISEGLAAVIINELCGTYFRWDLAIEFSKKIVPGYDQDDYEHAAQSSIRTLELQIHRATMHHVEARVDSDGCEAAISCAEQAIQEFLQVNLGEGVEYLHRLEALQVVWQYLVDASPFQNQNAGHNVLKSAFRDIYNSQKELVRTKKLYDALDDRAKVLLKEYVLEWIRDNIAHSEMEVDQMTRSYRYASVQILIFLTDALHLEFTPEEAIEYQTYKLLINVAFFYNPDGLNLTEKTWNLLGESIQASHEFLLNTNLEQKSRLARLLLDHDYQVDIRGARGALYWAQESGHPELIAEAYIRSGRFEDTIRSVNSVLDSGEALEDSVYKEMLYWKAYAHIMTTDRENLLDTLKRMDIKKDSPSKYQALKHLMHLWEVDAVNHKAEEAEKLYMASKVEGKKLKKEAKALRKYLGIRSLRAQKRTEYEQRLRENLQKQELNTEEQTEKMLAREKLRVDSINVQKAMDVLRDSTGDKDAIAKAHKWNNYLKGSEEISKIDGNAYVAVQLLAMGDRFCMMNIIHYFLLMKALVATELKMYCESAVSIAENISKLYRGTDSSVPVDIYINWIDAKVLSEGFDKTIEMIDGWMMPANGISTQDHVKILLKKCTLAIDHGNLQDLSGIHAWLEQAEGLIERKNLQHLAGYLGYAKIHCDLHSSCGEGFFEAYEARRESVRSIEDTNDRLNIEHMAEIAHVKKCVYVAMESGDIKKAQLYLDNANSIEKTLFRVVTSKLIEQAYRDEHYERATSIGRMLLQLGIAIEHDLVALYYDSLCKPQGDGEYARQQRIKEAQAHYNSIEIEITSDYFRNVAQAVLSLGKGDFLTALSQSNFMVADDKSRPFLYTLQGRAMLGLATEDPNEFEKWEDFIYKLEAEASQYCTGVINPYIEKLNVHKAETFMDGKEPAEVIEILMADMDKPALWLTDEDRRPLMFEVLKVCKGKIADRNLESTEYAQRVLDRFENIAFVGENPQKLFESISRDVHNMRQGLEMLYRGDIAEHIEYLRNPELYNNFKLTKSERRDLSDRIKGAVQELIREKKFFEAVVHLGFLRHLDILDIQTFGQLKRRATQYHDAEMAKSIFAETEDLEVIQGTLEKLPKSYQKFFEPEERKKISNKLMDLANDLSVNIRDAGERVTELKALLKHGNWLLKESHKKEFQSLIKEAIVSEWERMDIEVILDKLRRDTQAKNALAEEDKEWLKSIAIEKVRTYIHDQGEESLELEARIKAADNILRNGKWVIDETSMIQLQRDIKEKEDLVKELNEVEKSGLKSVDSKDVEDLSTDIGNLERLLELTGIGAKRFKRLEELLENLKTIRVDVEKAISEGQERDLENRSKLRLKMLANGARRVVFSEFKNRIEEGNVVLNGERLEEVVDKLAKMEWLLEGVEGDSAEYYQWAFADLKKIKAKWADAFEGFEDKVVGPGASIASMEAWLETAEDLAEALSRHNLALDLEELRDRMDGVGDLHRGLRAQENEIDALAAQNTYSSLLGAHERVVKFIEILEQSGMEEEVERLRMKGKEILEGLKTAEALYNENKRQELVWAEYNERLRDRRRFWKSESLQEALSAHEKLEWMAKDRGGEELELYESVMVDLRRLMGLLGSNPEGYSKIYGPERTSLEDIEEYLSEASGLVQELTEAGFDAEAQDVRLRLQEVERLRREIVDAENSLEGLSADYTYLEWLDAYTKAERLIELMNLHGYESRVQNLNTLQFDILQKARDDLPEFLAGTHIEGASAGHAHYWDLYELKAFFERTRNEGLLDLVNWWIRAQDKFNKSEGFVSESYHEGVSMALKMLDELAIEEGPTPDPMRMEVLEIARAVGENELAELSRLSEELIATCYEIDAGRREREYRKIVKQLEELGTLPENADAILLMRQEVLTERLNNYRPHPGNYPAYLEELESIKSQAKELGLTEAFEIASKVWNTIDSEQKIPEKTNQLMTFANEAIKAGTRYASSKTEEKLDQILNDLYEAQLIEEVKVGTPRTEKMDIIIGQKLNLKTASIEKKLGRIAQIYKHPSMSESGYNELRTLYDGYVDLNSEYFRREDKSALFTEKNLAIRELMDIIERYVAAGQKAYNDKKKGNKKKGRAFNQDVETSNRGGS